MDKNAGQIIEEMHRQEIGQRIRAVRLRAGLTQEKFAKLIGTTGTALLKWESGQHWPELKCLMPMCARFNVNYEYVLSGIDDRLEKAVALELENHLARVLMRQAIKAQKPRRKAIRMDRGRA